jgi:hypothetical protein
MTFAPFGTPVRIVARPKVTGLGEHWGVQLPDGNVAHLTPDGEQIVTYEQFALGRPVREIRRAPPEAHRGIVGRAMASVRRPGEYRLLDRNCETYATWLMGEAPRSPQVQGAVLLALIAAFVRFA